MPSPSSEQRRLEAFAGRWEGAEQLHPTPWDPQGGPAEATVHNRIALDGFALIQDFDQRRDGQTTFRGHGIFRWDATAAQYVLHWFDSMGQGPSEFRGAWDGDMLQLVSKGVQGSIRGTWKLMGDRYEFAMEVSGDGVHWGPFITGVYRRIG